MKSQMKLCSKFNLMCNNINRNLYNYHFDLLFFNKYSTQTNGFDRYEVKLVSILENIKDKSGNSLIYNLNTSDNLSVTNQSHLLEGIKNLLLNSDKRFINFQDRLLDIEGLVCGLAKAHLESISKLSGENDKEQLNELLRSNFKICKLLKYISNGQLLYNLLQFRSVYYKLSDDLHKNLFLKALIDHLELGKWVYDTKCNDNIDLYNDLTKFIKVQVIKVFENNFINTDDLITIIKLNSQLCDHTKSFPSFLYKICIKKLCKVKKLTEFQVDEIMQVIISKKFACSTRFMSIFIDFMRDDTLKKLNIGDLSTFTNYLSITYSNGRPSPRVIKYVDLALKFKVLNGSFDSVREITNILYFLAKNSYIETESLSLIMDKWMEMDFLNLPAFSAFVDKLIWITLKLNYENPELITKMCEISRSSAKDYTIIDVVKYLYSLTKYISKICKGNNNVSTLDAQKASFDNNLLNSINSYTRELKDIAWNRLDQMMDIQCISNYLFAITCTFGDLKIEEYRMIGDRILYLINEKNETIDEEAITQILWSFQKNSILHHQLIVALSDQFDKLHSRMNSGQISLSAQTLSTYSLLNYKIMIPLLDHAKNRLLALNKKNKATTAEFTKIISIIWSCVTAGCIDKLPLTTIIISEIFKSYHWQDFIRNSSVSTKRQLVHVVICANIGIEDRVDKLSTCIDETVWQDALNLCQNLDDMSTSSISQYKVRRALSELNVNFRAESIITTGLVADFEIKDKMAVLEIDGPCHYNLLCQGDVMDTDVCYGKTMYRPNGKTICRNKLFEKLGYKVISIPWFICHRKGLGEYIKQQLDKTN